MASRENKLRLTLGAAEIASLTDEIIAKMTAVGDEVAGVTGERTFENTVAPLARLDRELSPLVSSCDFGMHVSPDEAVRNASGEADEKLRKFQVDFSMRTDVYAAVLAFEEKRKKEQIQLSPEAARYLEKTLLDFVRDGLQLEGEKREKLIELKKLVSEKEVQFQKNLNEDTSKMAVSLDELEGMSEDFIAGLEDAPDGKKFLTLKYPDLLPAMQKCKRESTRKALDALRSAQCEEANTPLLEDTLRLRSEIAALLGYDNHADYQLEIRMSKKSAAVHEMYEKLLPRLIPPAQAELEALKALKEQEKQERGEPFDGKINSWDFQYYHTLLKQRKFTIDEDEVRNYFPLGRVKHELLKAYQTILSLVFTQVAEPTGVWHSDVELYEVADARSSAFIGYFYLDLHPREGKYGHAAVFGLQCGCDLNPTAMPVADAARQCPIAAMVANFSKPTADKPSLLKHGEVVTFFHEFGHVMHQLCTRARFGRFSGTATERDFVEAPSQMLENWCWDAEPLRIMSGLFTDEATPLPEALLANMVAAKNLNSALMALRQVFFGKFDMTIHSGTVSSTGALWTELREAVSLIPNSSGGNGAASFGHIMGGYDAGYYGYLWSEVFSADMFTIFKKGGLFSPEIGARYRECILEPGGTVDGLRMITNFLQRDLDPDAYLVSQGLIPAS